MAPSYRNLKFAAFEGLFLHTGGYDFLNEDDPCIGVKCYDAVLNIDLGKHKKGDCFGAADVNFQEGTFSLYKDQDDDEPCTVVKMCLCPHTIVSD